MAMRKTVSRNPMAMLQKIHLLDAPFSMGSKLVGSKYFPDMIRDHGLENILAKHVPHVSSIGRGIAGYAGNYDNVGQYCEALHDAIIANPEALKDFLLILGGDHSLSIGTINAIDKIQRGNTGVLWVDAHADINTSETSPSANIHGMSLAFLLGMEQNLTATKPWSWFSPTGLVARDIVYVGLRDVDPGEKEFIQRMGIKAFSVDDVDKYGIEGVMEQTHSHLSHKENLHMSFDIDVLDPKIVPHTGTHASGGLTEEEGVFICESMARSGRLTSMELVEVNPIIQPDVPVEQTLDVCVKLIDSTIRAVAAAAAENEAQ